MGTEKPKPWPKPKLGILRNVELFDAGSADTHKGQEYTDEDLNDIVHNFKKFSGDGPGPRVNPPCVIGHEENQDWLKHTGIPAAGWTKNIRKVGRKLYGDLAELPPEIADAIARGAYRYVSAELYDTPPAGVPGKGKMLRRVAFLGGELPHLKTLKRLPHPEMFSDDYDIQARSVRLRLVKSSRSLDGTYLAFSEVAMDRDQMIQMLSGKGVDKAVLDGMDDNQLQAMAKVAGSGEPGAGMEGKEKGEWMNGFREHCKKYADAYKTVFGEDMPVEMSDEGDDDQGDDDEGVDESQLDDGEKPADNDEGPDAQQPDEQAEEDSSGDESQDGQDDDQDEDDTGSGKEEFGEGLNTAPGVADEEPDKNKKKTVSTLPSDASGTKYFSEGELENMITRIVNKAVGNATGSLVKKFSESETDRLDSFLMQMDREGRISPSELDEANGVMSLRQELMSLDNTATIGKFSDYQGRQVSMTARQAKMAEIRRRPAAFKEKIKVETGTEVRHFSEKDLEMVNVRKFSEEKKDRIIAAFDNVQNFLKIYEGANEKQRAELLAGI